MIRETKKHSRSLRRSSWPLRYSSEPVMPKCNRNQSSSPARTNKCLPCRRLFSKRRPFSRRAKLTRGNAFQNICVPHLDTGDPLMQRGAVQISFERFDFGELWHRAYVIAQYSFSVTALLCFVSLAPNRSVTLRLLASRASFSTWSRRSSSSAQYFFLNSFHLLGRAQTIFATSCWARFPSASHEAAHRFSLTLAAKGDQPKRDSRQILQAHHKRV